MSWMIAGRFGFTIASTIIALDSRHPWQPFESHGLHREHWAVAYIRKCGTSEV